MRGEQQQPIDGEDDGEPPRLHVVGTEAYPFLLVAAGSFAVAALLLVGFVASRTIGIAGFIETGLQPAPQALLGILAEAAVLLLVGTPFAVRFVRWMLLAAPAQS